MKIHRYPHGFIRCADCDARFLAKGYNKCAECAPSHYAHIGEGGITAGIVIMMITCAVGLILGF